MLKKKFKSILFTILFTFSVHSVWAIDTKQLADSASKKAVALLRTLDDSTFEAFQSQLATEQQTLDFAQTLLSDKEKQVKDAEGIREKIADRDKVLNKLRESGTRYGIIWDDIKLVGFDFEPSKESDQAVRGKLYFSQGQQYYSAHLIGFAYDDAIYLFNIEGLSKSNAEAVSEFLNLPLNKQ